jgi:hypothetical protein
MNNQLRFKQQLGSKSKQQIETVEGSYRNAD